MICAVSTQGGSAQSLSISEVAEQTGVSPAALRMWEIRHGFPTPTRLVSGHRRYDGAQVATVREVVRRRETGVRLDVAIQLAVRAAHPLDPPSTPSVYAELRRLHPWLHPQRMRKATLVALSWAIEDEFCARGHGAHLFASFQKERYWVPARARWRELARTAGSAHVFAEFGAPQDSDAPVLVALADDAPMRNEWAVVCDGPGHAAVLSAWEVPSQEGVPERDRLFEVVWSVDPVAVRDAARVCARVAAEAGTPGAFELEHALVGAVPDAKADLAYVTAVFNRVIAYVDHVRW
jgi:MerR family transcriptional regulator, light-induced transcriptional regulator